MVTTVEETNFFNAKMAKTAKVERGSEHTIKQGECLWNIAKENLGKNAKKSEILDYIYQIAKLNDFKSIEEMNNLQKNKKIFLPKSNSISNSKVVTPILQKRITQQKPKSNAELGFEDLKNSIFNTPKENLEVSCGFKGLGISNYSIEVNNRDNYLKKTVANFTADKNGNIIDIAFNGRTNEIDIRYDYEVNKNGQILKSDEFKIHTNVVGSVNKDDLEKIKNILKEKINEQNNKQH